MKNILISCIGAAALTALTSSAMAGYFVEADNPVNHLGQLDGAASSSLTTTVTSPAVTMTSSASLATGLLHARTSSFSTSITYYSIAAFGDTLHFTGATGAFSVNLALLVTGSTSGVLVDRYIGAEVLNTSGGSSSGSNVFTGPSAGQISLASVAGTVTPVSTSASDFSFLSEATVFLLPGASLSFFAEVVAQPTSNPSGLAVADFTGAFSITLPVGITFTSDSGVLLSSVPEPATLALLAGPLLLCLRFRHSRRSDRTIL